MILYALDSCVWIELLRGPSDSLQKKFFSMPPSSIKVPDMVRAELLFGAERSRQPEVNRSKVEALLAPLERLPFGGDAVTHYVQIRHALERDGQPIGPADLIIAATARSYGAVLVTDNLSEFEKVPGLLVEKW